MHKLLLSITLISLSVGVLSAEEVSGYLTVLSDGDRKDEQLGSWGDARRHDADQDKPFTLLKRIQPIPLRDRSLNRPWRIAVDPNQPRQRILGLGAAMTDSSAFVLHHLKQQNPSLYEFTMQRLFPPDHGAGFSYLRLPIGSSDDTATDAPHLCGSSVRGPEHLFN